MSVEHPILRTTGPPGSLFEWKTSILSKYLITSMLLFE